MSADRSDKFCRTTYSRYSDFAVEGPCMAKRVGFIQTGGIGDLIMILPIADHYEEQGWEIVWPVDERFVTMFRRIKPSINFLPVAGWPVNDRAYYLDRPLEHISGFDCERTIIFYMPILGLNISDPRLAASLKIDEYKYAISGVPFARKWQLEYERDMEREQSLYDSLQITGPYVCVHEEGANLRLPVPVSKEIQERYRIIRVEALTDSVFDWLLTFERADKLMFIDGCFANLVEQMQLRVEKQLFFRSHAIYTPVFRTGWKFRHFEPGNLVAA